MISHFCFSSVIASIPQRFVIIATPRSGSNWLCTLLDSHPGILCHHELFNPDGIHVAWSLRDTGFTLGDPELRNNDPLELLRRAWAQTQGFGCVGFKINRGQSEKAFDAVLNDPGIRKILVTRQNRIRAYVSEKIAEKTGQWESYPESQPGKPTRAVHVDVHELQQHMRSNHEYLEDIRRLLRDRDQGHMEVRYENIPDHACQRSILEYLGVDPESRLEGKTSRMNPQPLTELIRNFEQLAGQLTDPRSRWELFEEEAPLGLS